MFRATSTAALAVLTALMLAGCGSASAPAPEPTTASAPDASPTADESAPAASPTAETPAPTADSDATSDRAACEAVLLEQYGDSSPQAATDADLQAAADAITLVLPGRPSCGVVMDRSGGTANHTRILWLDQPDVGPELVRVLDSRGWASTQDDTAGVSATTYAADSLEVAVAAMGVDNVASGWGALFPGVDVTTLSVETS